MVILLIFLLVLFCLSLVMLSKHRQEHRAAIIVQVHEIDVVDDDDDTWPHVDSYEHDSHDHAAHDHHDYDHHDSHDDSHDDHDWSDD